MKWCKKGILVSLLLCGTFFINSSWSQDCLDSSFNYTGIIKRESGSCNRLFLWSHYIFAIDYVYSVNGGVFDSSMFYNGYFPYYPIYDMSHNANGFYMATRVTTSIDSNNYHWTDRDYACIKLNNQGKIDSAFGLNGVAKIDLPHWPYIGRTDDDATSIGIQSDGKPVIAGITTSDDLGIARFTTDGKVDSTFGDSVGYSVSRLSMYGMEVNDMAIMPDDRIIVGANGDTGTGDDYVMLAVRFLPNGHIDSSYNGTGVAWYSGGGWITYCNAMCLQPDGKVLLAGYADSGLVVRFDTSGHLDESFGNHGVCRFPPSAIRDMALAADGKVYITGTGGDDESFVTYRCTSQGIWDKSFGDSGVVATKIEEGEEDRANAIALQEDGKILVGGGSTHYSSTLGYKVGEFALVRYLPNGKRDNVVKVQVTPNPGHGYVNVSLSAGSTDNADLVLYDMAGRRVGVWSGIPLNTQPYRLSLSGLAAGVYVLHVTDHKINLDGSVKFVKR